MRTTYTKPSMTAHKWFDRRNLDLVIFANHITCQISIQMAMALRADIGPVVNNLVRVLMKGSRVALMSGFRAAGFGMFATGFFVG